MDRQKLLTIFGVAWLSAALLTWFLYAKTQAPKQEKTLTVVAASRELPTGTRIGKNDIKLVTVLEKNAPSNVFTKEPEALGRAVLYPIGPNEPVSPSRLSTLQGAEGAAAMLDPGKRAISVSFNEASGAAGLVQPRSHVDVLFTRTGNAFEALTVTVLEDVEVLSIGRSTQLDAPPAAASGSSSAGARTSMTTAASTSNRTATLILTPEQAQKLELAKNEGRISFSLRNPLDKGTRADKTASVMEQIDPLLLSRSGTRRPGKGGWGDEELPKFKPPPPPAPKPEPPKPRAIVDVFRGEKHVQEIFQ